MVASHQELVPSRRPGRQLQLTHCAEDWRPHPVRRTRCVARHAHALHEPHLGIHHSHLYGPHASGRCCGIRASRVNTLTQAGYKLQNASIGNSKVTKQRDYTWRDINRAADRAIDAAELAKTSAERRNRLYNDAQNLTKPEIARQRLTNSFPTAEELDAYEWTECPAEMLLWNRLPKDTSAIQAEYCKFGDYIFFVARRKHQAATYLKNTKFATTPTPRISWQKCDASKPRIHMIERLSTNMHDRSYWSSTPTYSF
jgi:hypothetical protein